MGSISWGNPYRTGTAVFSLAATTQISQQKVESSVNKKLSHVNKKLTAKSLFSGVLISNKGIINDDIQMRVEIGRSTIVKLQNFGKTKQYLIRTIVFPISRYDAETWSFLSLTEEVWIHLKWYCATCYVFHTPQQQTSLSSRNLKLQVSHLELTNIWHGNLL